MTFLGIDPGTTQTAYCMIEDSDSITIRKKGIIENNDFTKIVSSLMQEAETTALEQIQSFGMPVGREVFWTAYMIGRIIQKASELGYFEGSTKFALVTRKDVKMHHCHSMKAKDANIRQALLDKALPSGGGKRPKIGTKKDPGPLYGVKKDIWSALAIAVYARDMYYAHKEE